MINNNVPKLQYFFFDCEVDGINRDTANIRQIAFIHGGSKNDPADRYISQNIVPPGALRNTTLEEYQKTHTNARPLTKAWPGIWKWMQSKNPNNDPIVIISHKAFDWDKPVCLANFARAQNYYIAKREYAKDRGKQNKVIKYDDKQHLFKCRDKFLFFDTLALVNTLGICKNGESKTLSDLCKKLSHSELLAHTALNDALMTEIIFNAMIGKAPPEEVLIGTAFKDQNPIYKAKEVIHRYNPLNNTEIPKQIQTVQKVAGAAYTIFGVDTETSGLTEPIKIIQLGAWCPNANNGFEMFVNPDGKAIEEEATKNCHGITEEMVARAPTFDIVYGFFRQYVMTNTPPGHMEIILGHNFPFDLKLMRQEAELYEIKLKWMKILDTYQMGKNLFKKEHTKSIAVPNGFLRLQNLAPMLGMKNHGAHRAKGDSQACTFIWDKFVEGISEKDIMHEFKKDEVRSKMRNWKNYTNGQDGITLTDDEKKSTLNADICNLIRKVGKFKVQDYIPQMLAQAEANKKEKEKVAPPAPVKSTKVAPPVPVKAKKAAPPAPVKAKKVVPKKVERKRERPEIEDLPQVVKKASKKRYMVIVEDSESDSEPTIKIEDDELVLHNSN